MIDENGIIKYQLFGLSKQLEYPVSGDLKITFWLKWQVQSSQFLDKTTSRLLFLSDIPDLGCSNSNLFDDVTKL